MATGGINAFNAFIAGSDLDAIYLAPIGTVTPTDLDEELDDAFEHTGWIHSDGITETPTGSKTEIRGHQGQKIVRTRMETPGTQYAFVALEDKEQTDQLRYDIKESTVTDGVRHQRRSPGQKASPRVAVVDIYDADFTERKKRKVFPHVDITPNGDRVFAGSDIAGYPFLMDVIGDYDVYSSESDVTPGDPEP